MATLSPAAMASIQYQMAHLEDSRVPSIVACLVVCLPLACLAVVLRFLSGRIGKIPVKADDYWVTIAFVSH